MQVKRLNKSNQLGAEVSVALPIHLAQKLAKRVFNYFHYYVSNSASIVPDVIKKSFDQHEGYMTDAGLSAFIERQLYPDAKELQIPEDAAPVGEDAFQLGINGKASEEQGDDGDDEEGKEEEEIRVLEQRQIDRINSIKWSPWHDALRNKMFYL